MLGRVENVGSLPFLTVQMGVAGEGQIEVLGFDQGTVQRTGKTMNASVNIVHAILEWSGQSVRWFCVDLSGCSGKGKALSWRDSV